MRTTNSMHHIHFIGIGGIGMSGIAEVLVQLGFKVSGSDISRSITTDRLTENGVEVYFQHEKSNIKKDTSIVVYSSAINFNNPEIVEAKLRKIPIVMRADILADLMKMKKGLTVAGTHGKTTTTSMLATIFHECGKDPTHVIGGIVNNLGTHGKNGNGEYFIAEADESDGSFLKLNPIYTIVTNIDSDHLDFYGDTEKIFEAFKSFVNNIPFYGFCLVNGDDENCRRLKAKVERPVYTYGIKEENRNEVDMFASNISYSDTHTTFDVEYLGENIGTAKINTYGLHNVSNALAAISMAKFLNLDIKSIFKGIEKFKGVGRRFELLYRNQLLKVYNDYAHHPTEINCMINAVKEISNGKVIVYFEPHRYSRTKECWGQFESCFEGVDELNLLEIYPASESPIEGVTSSRLKDSIKTKLGVNCNLVEKFEASMEKSMNDYSNQEAIILILGAGKIGKFAYDYFKNR